jgi:arylsulfatase A-like enzyme
MEYVAERGLLLTSASAPAAVTTFRDLTPRMKPLGYVTGQFWKNHLGDRNEFLPTAHGFDESSACITRTRKKNRLGEDGVVERHSIVQV